MGQRQFSEDARGSVEAQINELRDQLSHIAKSLSKDGLDLRDWENGASNFTRGARKSAQRAARHAQHEVEAVATTARENPATVSTALSLVGAIGFGLGYLCGLSQKSHHRGWRH